MKYWILGGALLLLPLPVSSQRTVMPRGSFLTAPARSTQALLKQYDSNPEVRRRYMKIFGRSESETREILARLSPKELPKTQDFPVAYYSESGKWLYREKTLTKGTVVYVTPEGKPFLKEECGNPLVLSLPYPKGKPVASIGPPIKLPMSLEQPPLPVTVGPQPSPETLLAPGTLPAVTSSPPANLAELYAPTAEAGAIPADSPGVLAPPGVPAGDNPFWLALLIPLLFLGGGGGGGGGGPCCGPPPPPPPTVPEASSWVLLTSGGLGVLLAANRGRILRKKKSGPSTADPMV